MKHSGHSLHYSLITAGFWMQFCIAAAYAAVYLQGAGFSNTELGLVLALGNLGGAVLSPVLGSRVDRNPKLRHATVIYSLLGLQTVCLAVMSIHPRHDLLTGAAFMVFLTASAPVNAMNLDLCVRLERVGLPLNFGLSRAMGSLSYVLLSALLGPVTQRWGFVSLPWAGLAVTAFQFGSTRLMDGDLRAAEKNLPPAPAASRESASLLSFVRENGRFCLMLLGTIFLFTAHNIDGNFLINEIRALGGGADMVGYMSAFTAVVEIPVMIFALRLIKKEQTAFFIRLSFVFFTLKILAYALAPTLPLLFASRILQAPSYALYTVLIVGYAESRTPPKDSAKAQSLAFSMTTVGSVVASLLGGVMFDSVGVRPTMLTAAGIAALGTAVALAGTYGRGRNSSRPQ